MTPPSKVQPDVDRALATLVGIAEDLEEPLGGPGLVLTLPGLLVSGKLTPGWYWAGELGERDRAAMASAGKLISAGEHAGQSGYSLLFEQMATTLQQTRDERRAAETAAADLDTRYRRRIATDDEPSFVHLRDAQVYLGGAPIPSDGGLLWRGRLSEVSGWTFGELGPARET